MNVARFPKESTMDRSSHLSYLKTAAYLEKRLAQEQAISEYRFKLQTIHEAHLRDYLAAREKPPVEGGAT